MKQIDTTSQGSLKSFYPGIFLVLIWLFCLFTPAAAGTQREVTLTGRTMGTFYKIKYLTDRLHSKPVWQKKVDILLKQVNKRLSMYDPESELSLFNQGAAGRYDHISADFFTIIHTGTTLYKITHGAWDASVKPLVDLWGFGTLKKPSDIPGPADIQQALNLTGYGYIKILPPHSIVKQKPITLDFGSIAKGYGVDEVAALFISSGIKNVLVDIGGELFASGRNKSGRPWSVGISRPDKIFAKQTLYKVLALSNQAIATSGNYRNFYRIKGKSYAHIIDPKTGYPVQNKIVSASVVSRDCTFADGLATALMVMDVKEGIALVNSLEGTECLIVQEMDPGSKPGRKFIDHLSKNFNALLTR